MINKQDTIDFINQISAGNGDATLFLFSVCSLKTSFYKAADLIKQIEDVVELSKKSKIYVSLGRVQKPLPGSRKPKSADIAGISGLFLDIDVVKPGAHAQLDLPATKEEGLLFIEALPCPPSLIVDSGWGLHVYWWVDPISFANDAERALAGCQLKRLTREVQHLGKAHGWKIDDCSDLVRITRLPGTFNCKVRGQLVQSKVLQGGGPTYPRLDDIKFAEVAQSAVRLPRIRPQDRRGARDISTNTTPWSIDLDRIDREYFRAGLHDNEIVGPNFAAVAEGCQFVRSALSRAERLPEPEWCEILKISAACHGGDAIAHEISRADPRYDENETAAKIANVSRYPVNCTMVSRVASEACDGCAFRQSVKIPTALGWHKRVAISIASRTYHDVVNDVFVEEGDGSFIEIKPAAFTRENKKNGFKNAASELPATGLIRSVSGRDYLPHRARSWIEDGRWVLNEYFAPELAEERCDEVEELFCDHLLYLCGDREDDFQDALNYIAWIAQGRSKITHALLFQTGQGMGKGSLVKAITGALGKRNVVSTDFERLTARFNADVANRQLVVIEELQRDGREAYDQLKTYISEEELRVERKHVAVVTGRTPLGVIINTNASVPLKMESDDRRYFVIQGPAEKRSSEYYNRFHAVVLAKPGAVRAFLMNVDLSGYDPKAPPRPTQAKQEILLQSPGQVEQILTEAIEQFEGPAECDVTDASEWCEFVRRRTGKTISATVIARILNSYGHMKLGQIHSSRTDGPRRPYVYAVRNHARYLAQLPHASRVYNARSSLSAQADGKSQAGYQEIKTTGESATNLVDRLNLLNQRK